MESIIINGFFGKGNCGDEAILHTWYEKLSKEFKIIASVDSNLFEIEGNFNNNDIYQSIDLIQNRRVDIFSTNDILCFIIGGGGLGLGFGVEQWIHAKKQNKLIYYLGTIVHEEFFDTDLTISAFNKVFFKSFDYIMVRDKISKYNLSRKLKIKSDYFPDIAFGLTPEVCDFALPEKFISVTIRDNGENDLESIKTWLQKIQTFAKNKKFEIVYIPFDRTDRNLMESIGIEIKEEYNKIFWHPKKVKYIISKSQMVFSMGRFHPLVFSLSTGVTCYYIKCQKTDYEWRYKNETKDKSYNLLNDWGLKRYYLTNDDIDRKFKINEKKFLRISEKSNELIEKFFYDFKEKLRKNI